MALYSGGEPLTRVQGAEFGDTVYYSGGREKLRGTKYYGKLYDADGTHVNKEDDFYLDDGDYVTVVGDEVDEDLYKAGTNYPDGLYTSYHRSSANHAKVEPAKATFVSVTALTV